MSDYEGELYERKKTKDTVDGTGFCMFVSRMQFDGPEGGHDTGRRAGSAWSGGSDLQGRWIRNQKSMKAMSLW